MENQKPSPRYSAEERQQFIEQWKQSGISRQAFCRQNNLSYYSLIYWTKKKRHKNKFLSSEFIPLKVKPDAERIFAQIEAAGKRLQLYQPVTAHFLKQLLS